MEFYSRSNRPPRKQNECGCHMIDTYARQVDENGIVHLRKDGQRDIYAHIQTFTSECQIYNIIDRVERTGDLSPLYSMQGRYQDVSGIPTTLAGILQFRMDAENNFRKLPHDIRARFNDNPHEFMANPQKLTQILQEMSRSFAGSSSSGSAPSGSAAADSGAGAQT